MVDRNRILANILQTRVMRTPIADMIASIRAADADAEYEVEVTVTSLDSDVTHRIEVIAHPIKIRVSQGDRPIRAR